METEKDWKKMRIKNTRPLQREYEIVHELHEFKNEPNRVDPIYLLFIYSSHVKAIKGGKYEAERSKFNSQRKQKKKFKRIKVMSDTKAS